MSNNIAQSVMGYSFTCLNSRCSYFNTGFTLYREWPIAHIDAIVNSNRAGQELKNRLLKNKKEGRKYALLILPNKDNTVIVGKRIVLFCVKDCIIWERDLVDKKDILNTYCDKCKERLITADEAKEHGILCPSCKGPLSCESWFSNI